MPELHPKFLTDPDGKPRSVLLPFEKYAALMDYPGDIKDVRAAEDALRKIEPGEDSVISLDEFLLSDLAR